MYDKVKIAHGPFVQQGALNTSETCVHAADCERLSRVFGLPLFYYFEATNVGA